jgi:hypothetical protein
MVDAAGDPSAWAVAMQQLAAAGDRITALLHERGEPGGRVDASVALLGATMDAYLNQISADPDFPTFVPCCGFFQHTGSPNPDTVYRRAAIDGAGTYRLTGERGDARQVTIMAFAAPTKSGMASWPPFDLADLTTGPDGRFDVLLGSERPPGHSGDWWPLEPGMASLWLRTVSDDWGNEREPHVAITRVDGPRRRGRPSGAGIEAKLRVLGTIVERTIAYGVRHVDELVDAGIVNDVKLVDYGANGGMPLQWYHEGVFDLDDGEVLLLEATLPPGCDYFSLSLTDRMFVTLDWVHAQTSLNRHQATVDDDGVLRVVVGADDPGVRNWMDTMGHERGVLQCRWIGSEAPPDVSVRVVSLASLAEHLPASTDRVTSEGRERARHDRATGAQLRSLW